MATRHGYGPMMNTTDNAPVMWLAQSENYSGGMDSATDPRDIDKLQVQLVKNGYVARSNRAVKRPGFDDMLSSDFASPVRALRRFKSADGAFNGLIVWEGLNVWERRDDGELFLLLTREATPDYEPPVTHCEFGEKVYFAYAWSGLLSLEVTSDATSAVVYSAGIGAAIAGTEGGFRGAAVAAGYEGNALVLDMVNDGPSTSLSVGYADGVITVHLATNGSGVVTSDATAIVAALNADSGVAAVAAFEVLNGSTLGAVCHEHFFGGSVAGNLKAWPVNADYDFSILATRDGSDRIFGVVMTDPASLRWCDALTPGTWNAASVWRPGGAFTGLIEISGVMVALQETRIMRIDGTDPDTWQASRAAAEGLGLPSGAVDTLRELEGVVVYLSQTGLTTYDGSRPRVISNAVKDAGQACRNYIPLTYDEWSGAFIETWRDFIILFYKSDGTVNGCDRALLYDFRRSIWAGVWEFSEGVTCASCDETSADEDALLILGTYAGNLLRESESFADNGTPFEFLLRTKVYDCGRQAIDKQAIEMRVQYLVSDASDITVDFFREDDLEPVTTVTHSSTAHEEDVITKRIPHVRGRDFYMEVSQTADVYLEVSGNEFDYFFVARR